MSDEGRPCALSVAGLDPSGGAGFLADLKAFHATGAWGCAVAAVLTVQSTAGLERVISVPAEDVRAQAEAIFRHQRVRAWKTGALGSEANVRVACSLADAHALTPLVVDPVIIATRTTDGARLLDGGALDAMRSLVARAWVVTPNVDEAEALLETRVRTLDEAEAAARLLVAMGARAAVVKGGHLDGDEAVDVVATRTGVARLRAPRVPGLAFHGGGCTFAALVAGSLAVSGDHGDDDLVEACREAKAVLAAAVERSLSVGDGLRVVDVLSLPR